MKAVEVSFLTNSILMWILRIFLLWYGKQSLKKQLENIIFMIVIDNLIKDFIKELYLYIEISPCRLDKIIKLDKEKTFHYKNLWLEIKEYKFISIVSKIISEEQTWCHTRIRIYTRFLDNP